MPWPFYEEPPDFIDRFKVLYFEVDKDVWEYEPEKYEPKVLISKVTVLDAMAPDEETQALDDDPPPGMEDCIAVDALRQSLPTAFPDVFFEIDKQNKLFQRVWNISHASNIRRLSYVDGSVIWRFCYDGEDAEAPTYFSVER